MAEDAQKGLDEIARRKTSGQPGPGDAAVEEVYKQTIAKAARTRADYETKFGKATLALFDKYERQYLELLQEQMGSPAPQRK